MNITKHIEACGLNRAEICARSGISRSMLSLIERGQRRIGVEKAAVFAAALGVPVQAVRPDLAEMFAGDRHNTQPATSVAQTQEHPHVPDLQKPGSETI